jgi:hypothetical protein
LQNIDPVFLLQPIITIGFSVVLVVYWHYKRRFTRAALFYSLLAYVGAIAAKIIVQNLTLGSLLLLVGDNAPVLGTYLGLQTVFLEVGGAFLVARFALSRRALKKNDAEGYGLGLGLWENAGVVGGLGLINLIVIYTTLASGNPLAQQLYSSVLATNPTLFDPPFQALPLIGWAILERVSSLLLHISWGYLTLMAAYMHKRSYLLAAMPMGFIDFIVPFNALLTLPILEAIVFAIAVGCLIFTIWLTQDERR